MGVADLVAVVGSHVGATSRYDFRIARWAAVVLSLATSAIGVRLSRGGGSEQTAPAASQKPEAVRRLWRTRPDRQSRKVLPPSQTVSDHYV
jgi:hypothetical protein